MVELVNSISVMMGASWASGVRLYLTIAGLGLAHRMHWIDLPGNLDVLANPLIILVAGVLYALEFVSDKVPVADSILDAINTFIKPAGGALLAYLAVGDSGPLFQTAAALFGGGVSLTTHAVKATTRAAINASPEPVSNVVASTAEDGVAAGGLWLLIANPVVMAIGVVLFLIFAVWFLKKMFRFLKGIFRFFQMKPKLTG